MTQGREPSDPLHRRSETEYLEFRLRTVRTAVWPTVFVATYCFAYYAITWGEPHRTALIAISIATILGSALLPRLPLQALVSSRWREPFFVGWSSSLVAVVLVACLLDGGVDSPIALAFFLPLAYAALSYPRASIVAVTASTLAGFLGLAALAGQADAGFMMIFAGILITQGWVCAWQASNHDHQNRALARLSRIDPLTGALNRRGFDERLAAELGKVEREGGHLAVVLFDLDDFKQVNDTAGHEAGDEVLRLVVNVLRQGLRPHDAIARLGGDEFAVLLDQRREAVTLTVRRLLASLEEHAPSSAGVAYFPTDGADATALCRHADSELYARKSRPRRARAKRRISLG